MGTMNDPVEDAPLRRHTRSRKHAEIAIQTAVLVCEACQPTDAQLADLADAVDALRGGQFHAATVLAEAAIEGRSRTRAAIRPAAMTRSIPELQALLAEIEADRKLGGDA